MRKGQSQTPEARAKISAGMRGKGKSASTREKMAMAKVAYWAKRRNKRRFAIEAAASLLDEGPVTSATDTYEK